MLKKESSKQSFSQSPKNLSFDQEVDEVRKELAQKKDLSSKINWGSFLITFLLSLLFLGALAQTVQSAFILKKVQNKEFLNLQKPSSTTLEDLPEMVGGC